jgi:hypothetical protein
MSAAASGHLLGALHPEQLLPHGGLEVRHQQLHPKGHFRWQIEVRTCGIEAALGEGGKPFLEESRDVPFEPPVIRPITRE